MKRMLKTGMAVAATTWLTGVSSATVHYVNVNSKKPKPPYTNWVTAATTIQNAVDVAGTNDVVLVTNGAYAGGITVTNPLALLTVKGPQFTRIDGGGTVQCISLADGASLTGFTLTNGAGPGVWCTSRNAFLTNCVIVGNQAMNGGGVYRGTLYNCIVTNNHALGFWRQLSWTWQFFGGNGGGVYGGTLFNCLLAGNSANAGGGAAGCTLYNCTLTGNVCSNSVGPLWIYYYYGRGGGAAGGTLYNCIVCSNTATSGANYFTNSVLNYCCTAPMPTNGVGNITNEPAFVNATAGDFHLQANSPCINAGNNAYVTTATDLDGHPRIVSGTVDIGAYEYQGTGSVISYAWLQQNGLPVDGSADYADPDHDGMNNRQEWICGTCPTNTASVLMMIAPTQGTPGLNVTWQSVDTRTYYLQRSTNLSVSPAFSTIQSKILGQAGTTTYTDTNAVGAGPFFYQVGVNSP